MSLTKNGIIKSVQKAAGLTRTQSVKTVGTTLEIIKKTLESDEDILISGFGKLFIKNNSKRRGGNLKNSNAYIPEAKKVVTFRCSPVLVKKLNSKQ